MSTYNRARYLAESIQSILDQSFKEFDIIIIDDGSTDNTEEILSDFPVRYLGQENQGPAAALNKAIELSQAEYIAFQGSDDIFLPEALTKSMTILDNHPEVAFSHGQAYLIDEAGQVFGLRRPRGENTPMSEKESRKSGDCFFGATTLLHARLWLDEAALTK